MVQNPADASDNGRMSAGLFRRAAARLSAARRDGGFGPRPGMAAEPGLARAERSWLLPDGTTVEGQDAWVVVMNPFASIG